MKDLVCINKEKIFKSFQMKSRAVLILYKSYFLLLQVTKYGNVF